MEWWENEYWSGNATKIENLEDTNVRLAIFEEITATSGTVTKPSGSTIVLDQFSEDADAIILVLSTTGQKPAYIIPTDSTGAEVLVSSFDTAGAYTLSGTPYDHGNSIAYTQWAIQYTIDIPEISHQSMDRDVILERHEPKPSTTDLQDVSATIPTVNGQIFTRNK